MSRTAHLCGELGPHLSHQAPRQRRPDVSHKRPRGVSARAGDDLCCDCWAHRRHEGSGGARAERVHQLCGRARLNACDCELAWGVGKGAIDVSHTDSRTSRIGGASHTRQLQAAALLSCTLSALMASD